VLNSITGFTTLQPYISFIISENINLSLFLLFVVLCCKFYVFQDKAELVPKFLGQAREFLTDSTSVVTVLFILMMMYIFMFFIGTLYGDGKAGVDKDCGILFIILIVIFIIFVFNNVLKCLYWTGSLIIYQRPSKMSTTI
jgi:hypothetical protein